MRNLDGFDWIVFAMLLIGGFFAISVGVTFYAFVQDIATQLPFDAELTVSR